MLFGAFFAAYFFIHRPGQSVARPGTTLPVEVAGISTAILVSSASLTMH